MKTWLISYWERLRANFWFVPTLMVVGAIALSFGAISLDRATGGRDGQNWLATLGWVFTRGPEGSRAVLSTTAGSMVTIASITFSITVVALQLASSQFGPRLLRNFMRDRGNQVALGTFISTFTYCLLVLRTVNGTGPEDSWFVPHISVTIGVVLALASLGVLIYFIHHAAASIQADNVIASVAADLDGAIDRLYPEDEDEEEEEGEPSGSPPADPSLVDAEVARDIPDDFDRRSCPIPSAESDYLQAIDDDGLMTAAVDKDLIIRIAHRPGQFVVAGNPLARAWPADRVDEETVRAIRGAFYLGRHRTLTQDVEFAVDQLVEIALRALSPGLNDPFTAITCIDRLGAALCRLAGRRIPSAYRRDDDGRLRVVASMAESMSGIVDATFHQVRQSSRTNAAVTLRLLETIATVLGQARAPTFRAALLQHAAIIHRGSQEGLPDPWDRAEADRRYRLVLDASGEAVEAMAETT